MSRPWLLLLAALVVASCGRGHAPLAPAAPPAPAARPSPAASQAGLPAVVTRVVDGDTVRVRIDGRGERVRLIGIDTPESVKPDTPVQCFALEASARTKALLPSGTAVRLVGDVESRDRYGRLLAYLYRAGDGLFVNLSLARDGFAVPYTFPPNVAHTDEFVAAAADARRAGRGLWSRCAPDAIPHH